TDSQRQIRALARDFAAREIAPHADEWDRTGQFPRQAVQRMAELGLLGMTAEERWGGIAADSVSLALAVEEIARADASTSLVLSMANSLSILSLARYGTAAQQERWMPSLVNGECIA